MERFGGADVSGIMGGSVAVLGAGTRAFEMQVGADFSATRVAADW